MILFLTHEKDFFAKQCYLMLKYQHQVPTRWVSWQSFKKQSQCHTLGLGMVFNPLFPAPEQVNVLYVNLIGISEFSSGDASDKQYHLHSWLGFLMWYANEVDVCINSLKHVYFSPGLWTKQYIRRKAASLGLNTQQDHKNRANIVCTFIGNQLEIENKHILSLLGHQKIDASFKLMQAMGVTFGQLLFDETLSLCKFSPCIQIQITVPVIIKACRYMLLQLSNKGFVYSHALEDVGQWTIASSLRPKMIG